MREAFPVMHWLLFTLAMISVCEVRAGYHESIEVDQPVLWWSFDYNAETSVWAPAVGVDSQYLAIDRRPGVSHTAALFRGSVSRRVEVSLTPEQDSQLDTIFNGSFTLEMWVVDVAAAPDNRTNYSLLYKADKAAFTRNSLWLYRARANGNYLFNFRNPEGAGLHLEVPNPGGRQAPGDDQWHHVVIVVDRNTSKPRALAYLDGREVDRVSITEPISFDNNGPLLIGNNPHSNSPWQGALDELAIYNRALSSDQIAKHHQQGRSELERPEPPKSTPPSQASLEEFFELKIRPLFVSKCADCHSGDEFAESPLAFTSRQALLQGSEFGPTIVPGNSRESLLVRAVKWTHKELHMPPYQGDRLTPTEIEHLERWINDGAVWPGSDAATQQPTVRRLEPGEPVTTDHWSYLPRTRPSIPEVSNADWSTSSIDRFLFQKMAEQGLTPAELADKRTLIRRATFDLIGLPPTPAEIEAFLADPSDDAYAKLIDRLLDTPQYGERWGRHWLDVARYADTQGDVGDFPIPGAYRYRNWVIDALNADIPYDRFIQAQLAGDVLAREAQSDEEARDLMVATGFISLSRRFGNTKHEDQYLTIEDTIDTLGRGVLGVTIRCARCHDHKFDPLLQADYFGLYGMFESTRYPTMGASNEKSPYGLTPPVPDPEKQRELDEYFELLERYAYQINNHHRPWLKPTLEEFKQISDRLKEQDLAKDSRDELEARREKLLSRHKGAFRELMLHGLNWIKQEKDRLAENPPTEMIFAVSEGEPTDSRMHLRGNPETPGPVVPRQFINVLTAGTIPQLEGSGRLDLARWITSPDHPLTARVIVNRVWAYHFGRGLVATPSNFGVQGSLPSHPELLDHLANSFVESDGWSLKSLHRRIMLSRAYRLASDARTASVERDPENIYLSRHSRRRLDAESIRDAILAVSGTLDPSRGGEFPFPHWKNPQFSLNNPFKAEYASNRRSVYLMTQRLFRQPFFALFDGPDRNQSTETRGTSTLPTQVLYLLNSEFVQQQAAAFARRLTETTSDDEAALSLAYQLAYGRSPTKEESGDVLAYVTKLSSHLQTKSDASKDSVRLQVWTGIAKVMVTSNEFLFVE